jgi:hypothetical protein
LIGAALAWSLGLAGAATAQDVAIRDACCFDLDGGGKADDGILVLSRGGTEVLMILIYEDPDQNKKFDTADKIRGIFGQAIPGQQMGTPGR